jgi:hypothetical protein
MFGRHSGSSHEGKWAARHGWRAHFGPGGRGGRGMGDDLGGSDFTRARRMLAHGDLRLIALALIAQQPRHGYEIIKLLEDKTAGWYSPSPGIVYPTLLWRRPAMSPGRRRAPRSSTASRRRGALISKRIAIS